MLKVGLALLRSTTEQADYLPSFLVAFLLLANQARLHHERNVPTLKNTRRGLPVLKSGRMGAAEATKGT